MDTGTVLLCLCALWSSFFLLQPWLLWSFSQLVLFKPISPLLTLEPLFYWLLTEQEPGTHSFHHTLLAWRASHGHCPSFFSTAPLPICSNAAPFSPDSIPHQLPHRPPQFAIPCPEWTSLFTNQLSVHPPSYTFSEKYSPSQRCQRCSREDGDSWSAFSLTGN